MNNKALTANITIINKLGLHARAAAKLVETTTRHGCNIEIGFPERMVNAKSIMSVMLLAASQGTELSIRVEGDGAQTALNDVCAIINNRFDESE